MFSKGCHLSDRRYPSPPSSSSQFTLSCHAMNNAEFQLRGVGDPRVALHATSALPAWLWAIRVTRVLWPNPVGARIFGAAKGPALTKKMFGPAHAHRPQVARLARTLPLH